MTQIKTADATGAALDWLVELAKGTHWSANGYFVFKNADGTTRDFQSRPEWRYSTDWSQGGPIIERERINLEWWHSSQTWHSCMNERLKYDDQGEFIEGSDFHLSGPTPLIAACRCFVASKLGDTVEVPEELL